MAKPDANEPDDIEDDPVEHAKERFRICEETWAENHRLALEDIRFARLEEQWPEKIRRDRELDGKPCLTLNQLHGFIFQVVNDARQNKPGIKVHPVGDGADVQTAEIFNGLIRHIEQSSDADVAYDTAMDAAVSSGFGFFRVNTRYSTDDNFNQDLVIERMADHLAVYPDPHSTAADSSDWNECFVIDAMPKKAFKKRWPDKEAVSFDDIRATPTEASDEEMVQIAECWTREEVTHEIVALSPTTVDGPDPEAEERARGLVPDSMIVTMEVYEKNKELFDELGVTIVGKPREVTTYKVTQCMYSGADELERIEWAGKFIPIVPVFGEELYVEGKRILRSLIRGAHDAQRMFNYWNSNATEMAGLGPKTPFIGKKGTFETDSAKWATINTEAHAYVEYDNEPPERPEPPTVPAAAIQMASGAQNNIMSIVGVYKSSIGADSSELSGVAINARDKQADTGTFHFVDNLSRAIRHCGRILLDLIPKVYSTPRMLRILEPDGTPTIVPVNQPTQVPQTGPNGQPVQDPITGQLAMIEKTLDLTQGKYDLVVKAGPSFATQREQMIAGLTQLVSAEPKLAPVVADLYVKNFDIPDGDEIVKRIEAMNPTTDPELAKAKDMIGKLQQQLGMAQQKIASKAADADSDTKYLQIEAYEAETDRLKAILGKDGANPGLQVVMPLVAMCLQQLMNAPDPMGALQQMAGAPTGAPPQPPGPPMSGPGAPIQPHLAPVQAPGGQTSSGPGLGQAA